MYMAIALKGISSLTSVNVGTSVSSGQKGGGVATILEKSNKKFLANAAEEKAEKAAKKAAKKVKEATKAEKKARKIKAKTASFSEFLAKTSAKKFEGAFRAGPTNHAVHDDDISAVTRAAALRGLTGKESEEEVKAVVLANMKEFIRSNLQAALAEHINGKVTSGKILPDNSNYIKELGKSWRKVSESFIKGAGEDLLELFGSLEELASFMASMEAELGLEDREITQVVEVQGIDPAQPAAPSIRANDQVHEVPASMEGLQADVARLNEKFGK